MRNTVLRTFSSIQNSTSFENGHQKYTLRSLLLLHGCKCMLAVAPSVELKAYIYITRMLAIGLTNNY